jgi:hypothetical protein
LASPGGGEGDALHYILYLIIVFLGYRVGEGQIKTNKGCGVCVLRTVSNQSSPCFLLDSFVN